MYILRIEDIALTIRQDVFRMACRANGGHIAPAFSMADIIAELYFDGILKYNVQNPHDRDRDFFILSKGHGVLALYSALSLAGFFSREELDSFCQINSNLGSLAKKDAVPGIEASTGSLGHGFSYALGIALANKIDARKNHVYVLVGDGECEEGSIWEAAMSASHHGLDNLTLIVDNNKLQAMDSVERIMSVSNLSEKFAAFGFDAEVIDGHDYREIKGALAKHGIGKPRAIIANTIKGKGISYMENVPIWHYRIPTGEELTIALRELKLKEEDLGHYEKCLFRNII